MYLTFSDVLGTAWNGVSTNDGKHEVLHPVLTALQITLVCFMFSPLIRLRLPR